MTLELNIANLIAIGCALVGALWALVKLVLVQHDRRLSERFDQMSRSFTSLAEDLRKEAEATRALERAFLEFKAELPRDYVRREDFIRSVGSIEARIDNFALRMERALTSNRESKP